MLSTYSKCCPRDANNYNRRLGTFPLLQFMSEISVEGGKRVERAFKMMWEREYIEEAQKTYMGNMTNEEAKRQWEDWKNNPDHPSDHDGPRGFLRLEVPMGDYHKHYQAGAGRPAAGARRAWKPGDAPPVRGPLVEQRRTARRTWPTAHSPANMANGAQPGKHS